MLLQFRKIGDRILWHGELRDIPLPAGVCGNSPWIDITQSASLWEGDKKASFDYLPAPGPIDWAKYPACGIWPTNPARKRLYVDDDLAAHPLANLAMCRDWTGCPPVYICTGWELLSLEDRFFAQKLVRNGVTVVFEEYEAMPHVFALVLTDTPNAQRCYERWSSFIRAAVEDPSGIQSSATNVSSKKLEDEPRKFEELCSVTEEQMRSRILATVAPEATAKL